MIYNFYHSNRIYCIENLLFLIKYVCTAAAVTQTTSAIPKTTAIMVVVALQFNKIKMLYSL